jgi:hypothetical protein
MEGGGDEERMHEVAPDLNGTLEDNYGDEDEQQQQDAVEDDEPQHGDEDEHIHGFQNGGSAKDAMVESDPKDSPTASQGKASSSGLVASGPSSSSSSSTSRRLTMGRGGSVLWLGLRRGLHVGG